VLLDAFVRVRHECPDARLLIVPHEPTPAHIASLQQEIRARQLPEAAPADAPDVDAPIQYVDRVGVLARLYQSGTMAYVGGGFGDRGIHSVLEPAAAGRPVFIGPHDRGNRDAALLEANGALRRLTEQTPAEDLAAGWTGWLLDPDLRSTAGIAARATLEAERGASERSAAMLLALVSKPFPGIQ
jgi:3-deoxy-D-manno-octulosonic-acid transferase